jgi:arsenate reductase
MKKLNVLFLCTGNSARSIFGEYILRKKDPFRFETYSAGAAPKDAPHPLTLSVLRDRFQIDPSGARSKSWDEFKGTVFDFVITVCDNARESCPVWPGQPIVAHWGSPDPAEAGGENAEKVFFDVASQIARRIDLFLNLPVEKLDRLRLDIEKATKEIGER